MFCQRNNINGSYAFVFKEHKCDNRHNFYKLSCNVSSLSSHSSLVEVTRGACGSVVRAGCPITGRLALWFPLSPLKDWWTDRWRVSIHLLSTAKMPLSKGTVPPCSPGAVNGCPLLQCMTSVSMNVWQVQQVLDGLNVEEKFCVFPCVYKNLILVRS